MRSHSFWKFVYHSLSVLGYVAGTLLFLPHVALNVQFEWYEENLAFLLPVLKWFKNTAPLTIPVLTGALLLSQLLKMAIGQPWVWDAVSDVLNQFKTLIADQDQHSDPRDRVTLFKIKKFSLQLKLGWLVWPWSRRLVPVARSGHSFLRTRVAFRIPDNAEKAEGVAGQTWSTGKTVSVSGLPYLPDAPENEDVAQYAKKTWTTPKWVIKSRKRKPLARSYYGFQVEVKNEPWGVIVVDRMSQEAISNQAPTKYIMTRCARSPVSSWLVVEHRVDDSSKHPTSTRRSYSSDVPASLASPWPACGLYQTAVSVG